VKVIYWLMAGLCAAVSLGALFYTIYWRVLPLPFLFVINAILVLAMSWLVVKAGLGTKSAFVYMALLWPGVGTLLLYLVSLFSKGGAQDGEQLRDYEKYIEGLQVLHAIRPLSAAEVNAEVNILPGVDVIRFATPTYKKEFMLGSKGQDLTKEVRVLRRALRDNDPEVRHYAAAMMAEHSDALEKEIQVLKDKVRRDPAHLLPLVNLYERYLRAGLLAKSIKPEFADGYLALLWQAKQIFPNNYEVAVTLLQVLVDRVMYKEARSVLLDIAATFPGHTFPLLLEMRLEFAQGNYQQVAALARTVRDSGWEVPETHAQLVDYWV